MSEDMDRIVAVTEVLSERALEAHRRNRDDRHRVEAELAEIDRLRAAVQSDADTLDARRLIGADTMWQGWLARRRMTVQQHLAMARAHEMESVARAQTAFARHQAAEALAREAQDDRRRQRQKRQGDQLETLAAMRSFTGDE